VKYIFGQNNSSQELVFLLSMNHFLHFKGNCTKSNWTHTPLGRILQVAGFWSVARWFNFEGLKDDEIFWERKGDKTDMTKCFYKYDDFFIYDGLFMSLLVVMPINHSFLLEILWDKWGTWIIEENGLDVMPFYSNVKVTKNPYLIKSETPIIFWIAKHGKLMICLTQTQDRKFLEIKEFIF